MYGLYTSMIPLTLSPVRAVLSTRLMQIDAVRDYGNLQVQHGVHPAIIGPIGPVGLALILIGIGVVIYGVIAVRRSKTSPEESTGKSQSEPSTTAQSRGNRAETRSQGLRARLRGYLPWKPDPNSQGDSDTDRLIHLETADEDTIKQATEELQKNGSSVTGANLNAMIKKLNELEAGETDIQDEPLDIVPGTEQYAEELTTQLAPDSVDEHTSYYTVVDEYGTEQYRRQLIVAEIAQEIPLSTFDKFQTSGLTTDGAHLKISYQVHPRSQQAVQAKLKQQVRKRTVDIRKKNEKGRIDTVEDQTKLETADALWESIQSGNNKLFDLSIYIELAAPDLASLDDATTELKTDLRKYGVKVAPFFHRQTEGWVSGQLTAPDIANHSRPVDLLAMQPFYPFKDPNIIHPEGALFGVNINTQMPLIVNPFQLSGHSIAVTGKIGSGKSYFAGCVMSDLVSMQSDIELLIIDPRGGFTDLVEQQDGDIIDITSGSVLNPLRIEPLENRDALGEIEGHPYDNKLDSVVGMIRAHFETGSQHRTDPLTKDEEGILRRALYHAYLEKGITSDIDTHGNQDPIIEDLRRILLHMSEGDDPRDILDVPPHLTDEIREKQHRAQQEKAYKLYLGLEDFAPGGQYDNLNGQSTISPSNKALMFDLSGVPESENNLFMHIVLDWLFQRAKKTENKNIICIDEVHYMFRSEQATEMLNLYTRQSRHNRSSMIFISQTVDEFLRNDQARDIYNQCDIKTLMYHADLDDEAAETLNLTSLDQKFIESADRGEVADQSEALTIVGDNKMQIRVRTDPITQAFADDDLEPWEYGYRQGLIAEEILPPDKQHLQTQATQSRTTEAASQSHSQHTRSE